MVFFIDFLINYTFSANNTFYFEFNVTSHRSQPLYLHYYYYYCYILRLNYFLQVNHNHYLTLDANGINLLSAPYIIVFNDVGLSHPFATIRFPVSEVYARSNLLVFDRHNIELPMRYYYCTEKDSLKRPVTF